MVKRITMSAFKKLQNEEFGIHVETYRHVKIYRDSAGSYASVARGEELDSCLTELKYAKQVIDWHYET